MVSSNVRERAMSKHLNPFFEIGRLFDSEEGDVSILRCQLQNVSDAVKDLLLTIEHRKICYPGSIR